MQIHAFTESLLERLKSIKQSPNDNDVIVAGKNLSAIRDIVTELKEFTTAYRFLNPDEEIAFFKTDKPVIMSHYYYHRNLLSLKLFSTFRDQKSNVANYEKILRKMKAFIDRNKDFYKYCISGETQLDPLYFTRSKSNPLAVTSNEKFSTGYDIILSKILANEMIREVVKLELSKMRLSPSEETSDLTWTAAKTDLIELCYALHTAGAFNNSMVDIRTLVSAFEKLFHVDLGNYYRVFLNIRIRKSGQTAFLDVLKTKLNQRIAEIEDR